MTIIMIAIAIVNLQDSEGTVGGASQVYEQGQ